MDLDEEPASKPKPKQAAKRGPKPKAKPADDSEDDFLEIARATAKQAAPTGRARKPVKYTAISDSDSDNGDDLLGDVSQMVKGIGGDDSNARPLISQRSRAGSSASLMAPSKSKISEFDPDETDYSKLVPQDSPRRSIKVTPKDVSRIEDDEDEEEEDEAPTKPAPRAKAAAKAKPAPKTAVARGRAKKDAAPALSPAAKGYASKLAKASKKKPADDDFSEDDIDAMANDILDSPAGKMDVSDDEPAPRRAVPARPSRRTAATTKKSYVIEEDSEDEEDSADLEEDESD
jgi:DNA topoisomerase-2